MLKNLYRQFLRPAAGAQRNEQELAGIRDLLRSARPAAGQAALASFLERNPHDPAALHLKGVAELDGGRHADALHWLLLAVEFDPDDAMFRANLGLAYWRLGQPHAARANLEASLAIRPDLASASLNLANVLLDLGEPGSARYRLDAALAHGDATAAAEQAALWTALAGLEAYIPDVDAVQCLNRAQALDPGSPIVPLLGYMPHAQRCDWRYPTADLIAFLERQAGTEDFDEGPVLAPAIADCLPVSRGARLATARRYGRMIVRRVAGLGIRRDAVAAARMGGRIRVGYLSADFHNHPTMQLLRGVLAAHDHQRFEWHAYSLGPDDGSGVRQEVQAGFTAFHDLRVDSPLDCAQRIAADGIDILVDLKGYTGAGRPEIMALRPAPVQVNYLGYPGSMAADFVDYLIADPVLIPEGGEAWYGEKIVRLPYCYQPNDNTQAIAGTAPDRAGAGLPDDAFVFCSFNSAYKIEPRIFSVWMEILARVARSVLWVHADNPHVRENLRREAHAHGIAPERLVFAASLPKPQHLARIRMADLFLDTHYVNAHTTASDALWAGLPLITCPGESFSSRVAASLLASAGMAELVCGDLDAYRDLAVDLAGDAARLHALRRQLAQARDTCPLFDTPRYTRHLEAAYELMHAIAANDAPPAAFCVARQVGARRGPA